MYSVVGRYPVRCRALCLPLYRVYGVSGLLDIDEMNLPGRDGWFRRQPQQLAPPQENRLPPATSMLQVQQHAAMAYLDPCLHTYLHNVACVIVTAQVNKTLAVRKRKLHNAQVRPSLSNATALPITSLPGATQRSCSQHFFRPSPLIPSTENCSATKHSRKATSFTAWATTARTTVERRQTAKAQATSPARTSPLRSNDSFSEWTCFNNPGDLAKPKFT